MTRAPSWVLPGAKFDFDFANQREWGGKIGYGQCTNLFNGNTFNGPTNSFSGYAPDRNGLLHPFPTYAPRITNLGLFVDAGSINTALYSRQFTNAVWTASGLSVAQNQVGADNSNNGAALLTATSASGTLSQAITYSSNVFITSFWMKRVAGSGAVNLSQDGGTTWINVASQLKTTGYVQVKTTSQSLTNPTIIIQIATSGDAVAVDFAQCEYGTPLAFTTSNTYATFPIVNTSSVNNRYAEENSFGSPGGGQPNDGFRVISEIWGSYRPWSMYIAYSGSPWGSGWLYSSDGIPSCYGGADGGPFTFQTSCNSPNNGNAGYGNLNKAAGKVNGFGTKCCLNGGAITSLAGSGPGGFPGNPSVMGSHVGIGQNGAGNGPGGLNGYIQRLALWDQEISDGQMIEWTRVVNNQ